MDYTEFIRSGTAPDGSERSGKTSADRVRPKTRGVVNGTSELADLNMCLKMDKTQGTVSSSYESSDDLEGDFQCDIETWEPSRRIRQTPAEQPSTTRKPRSAYTHGDPISAVYSSLFKPIKSGSPKRSPRATSTVTRPVTELHAAYGMPIGGAKRTFTPSLSSRKKSPSLMSTAEGKGKFSGSPTLSTVGSTEAYISTASSGMVQPPADNENTTSTSPGIGQRVSPKLFTAATSSPTHVTAQSSRVGACRVSKTQGPDPPAVRPFTSSSKNAQQSRYRDANSKGIYKQRSEHMRINSAGGKRCEIQGTTPRQLPVSVSSAASVGSSVNLADASSAKSTAAVSSSNQLSTSLDVDQVMETCEGNGVQSYSRQDSKKSQRPQSRKLYLGAAGACTDSGVLPLRAPLSAGAIPRRKMAHEYNMTVTPDTQNSDPVLSAAASLNEFVKPSTPWQGSVVNYCERPPSRQRSAFPTHLADMDSAESRSANRNGQKKSAFCAVANIDDRSNSLASNSSPRSFKRTTSTRESPLGRPPSRQRIAAQNLWDDETEIDAEFSQTLAGLTCEHTTPDEAGISSPDPGLISPLLTPYGSSLSIGGIVVTDDVGASHHSPSPNQYQPRDRAERARSAFGSSRRAPMYDPAADGFADLDSRSHTAPFKICLNHSSRKNSGAANADDDGDTSVQSTSPFSRPNNETVERLRRDKSPPSPTTYMQVDSDNSSPQFEVHQHTPSPLDGVANVVRPLPMETSKSTPALMKPAKYKKPAAGMVTIDSNTRSMSSDDMAIYGDLSTTNRIRKTPQDFVDDTSFHDEDLTVMVGGSKWPVT